MEYLFVPMAFLAGTALGLILRKLRRMHAKDQVMIDIDTFQYLKERDDELWELEKAGRARTRYISPKLKENKDSTIGCMN